MVEELTRLHWDLVLAASLFLWALLVVALRLSAPDALPRPTTGRRTVVYCLVGLICIAVMTLLGVQLRLIAVNTPREALIISAAWVIVPVVATFFLGARTKLRWAGGAFALALIVALPAAALVLAKFGSA